MTRLRVHMSGDPERGSPHDADIEIVVNGSQEYALGEVCSLLPFHVWYRWLDLDTGENGRNQDAFPALAEDWDEEVRHGWKYEVDPSGLPLEVHHGPAPLYKNDERLNRRTTGRAPSRGLG